MTSRPGRGNLAFGLGLSAVVVGVTYGIQPYGSRCTAARIDGRVCGATPLREAPFCFWHAPERAEDAAEARCLGGLRRKRERALVGAYDILPLDTPGGLRRVLELALLETLGPDSTLGRARTLITVVGVCARGCSSRRARFSGPVHRPAGTWDVSAIATSTDGDGCSGRTHTLTAALRLTVNP